jgi:hypothetical protein
MATERLGPNIGSGNADQVTETAAALNSQGGAARAGLRISLGGVLLVVVGAVVAVTRLAGPSKGWIGLGCLVVVLGLLVVTARYRERDREVRRMGAVLARYPWREYGHDEGYADDDAGVPRLGLRLLETGGRAVGTFRPVKAAGSVSVDGTVWFAGDPRFGGVLASPGGGSPIFVRRIVADTERGTAEQDRQALSAGLLDARFAAGMTAGEEQRGSVDGSVPVAGQGRSPSGPVPATLDVLRAMRRRARWVGGIYWALVVLQVAACTGAVIATALGAWPALVLLVIDAIPLMMTWWVARRIGAGVGQARRTLDVYAWEEWDCKAQRLESHDRVVLVTADDRAVCAVQNLGAGLAVHEALQGRATTLLFAGDVHYGGVVALSDGSGPTAVTCTPTGRRRTKPKPGAEDRARRAGLLSTQQRR